MTVVSVGIFFPPLYIMANNNKIWSYYYLKNKGGKIKFFFLNAHAVNFEDQGKTLNMKFKHCFVKSSKSNSNTGIPRMPTKKK